MQSHTDQAEANSTCLGHSPKKKKKKIRALEEFKQTFDHFIRRMSGPQLSKLLGSSSGKKSLCYRAQWATTCISIFINDLHSSILMCGQVPEVKAFKSRVSNTQFLRLRLWTLKSREKQPPCSDDVTFNDGKLQGERVGQPPCSSSWPNLGWCWLKMVTFHIWCCLN